MRSTICLLPLSDHMWLAFLLLLFLFRHVSFLRYFIIMASKTIIKAPKITIKAPKTLIKAPKIIIKAPKTIIKPKKQKNLSSLKGRKVSFRGTTFVSRKQQDKQLIL